MHAQTAQTELMLRRRGVVHLPTDRLATPDPRAEQGVGILEGDLAAHGWQVDAELREALTRLTIGDLVRVGSSLVEAAAALTGDHVTHEPLFPNFPTSQLTFWGLRGSRRAPVAHDPARLRLLHAGDDLRGDAVADLQALLARPFSLGGQDLADLPVLLDIVGSSDLTWLPGSIPGRSTRARVVAWFMERGHLEAADLLSDATDVLRTVAALSGGSADLTDEFRFRSLPRSIRRALLGVIDGANPTLVASQMKRRPQAFKRLGESLHPGEYQRQFSYAAHAFTMLRRGSFPPPDAAAVEAALEEGWVVDAAELLTQYPGDFARRLDHLLRVAEPDQRPDLLAMFDSVTPMIPTPLLLSVASAFRSRATPQRVFFPRGGAARTHVAPDHRVPLDDATLAGVDELITRALLGRAAAMARTDADRVDEVLVDAALASIPTPTGTRSSAESLVALSRGARLPVVGSAVRLFLHWVEPAGTRVDLDLSVMFFDALGAEVATCAYTNLRVGTWATHSGDLTSAPAPRGASEFVDIDVAEAERAGACRAVVVVHSYNDVPFDTLPSAFAGWMDLRDAPGDVHAFDARAVEQKFRLTGAHRSHLPLAVDLARREITWLDVAQGYTSDPETSDPEHEVVHATWNRGDRTATVAAAVAARFARHTSMFDVALLHAAGRARRVTIRREDGSLTRYLRAPGESTTSFHERLRFDDGTAAPGALADLAFMLRTVPTLLAPDAEVYAVHPGLVGPQVRLRSAEDVITDLM